MIDFCHIVPTKHLQEYDAYCKSYLILEHICRKDPAYREFFKKTEKFKILDNGAYETGFPSSLTDLLGMGEEIKAHEIVIPDVFQSREYTLKHFRDFEGYAKRHPEIRERFRFMAVPQGKTVEEYMSCLKVMLDSAYVNTIGLSFIVIQEAFRDFTGYSDIMYNRLFLTALLSLTDRKRKVFHLLGMGNCKELQYQVKYDWIRSADSSTCCVHGMNGIRFDRLEGLQQERIKTKLNFNRELTEEEKKIIDYNMEVVGAFLCRY